MVLVLTCLLCTAPAAVPDAAANRHALFAEPLSLRDESPRLAVAPVPLVLGRSYGQGSGDGEHQGDHGDHMGPMWILMGAMMVVMMVGMGVYLMRNSATGQVLGNAALASPAQLALPVSVARGAGG